MPATVTMPLDEYEKALSLQRKFGVAEGLLAARKELQPILNEIEFITGLEMLLDGTCRFAVEFDGATDRYRKHLRHLMIKSKVYEAGPGDRSESYRACSEEESRVPAR